MPILNYIQKVRSTVAPLAPLFLTKSGKIKSDKMYFLIKPDSDKILLTIFLEES